MIRVRLIPLGVVCIGMWSEKIRGKIEENSTLVSVYWSMQKKFWDEEYVLRNFYKLLIKLTTFNICMEGTYSDPYVLSILNDIII
ncbi:MAG: hypothetical protein ACXABO_20270 [Promethearchaeota archaeon]|jgi:hypothetical protein